MPYYEKRTKVLGVPVIIRKRVFKSRGWCIDTGVPGTCFNAFHMGRLSIFVGKMKPQRKLGKGWKPTDAQAIHTNESSYR